MPASIATTERARTRVPVTLPVDEDRKRVVRKVLLCCGILAALVNVGMNIFIPPLYPGYSPFSQTVSELSAIGAPTRQVWTAWGVSFTIFMTCFGCGTWLTAWHSRALGIAGALLTGYALVGMLWPPMHQRQVLAAGGKSLTDTLHIVFTAVTGLLILLAMGFAAAAFGNWFRRYSILTIVVLLVFGGLTSLDAPELEADLPTPWMGVWERMNIYATMLWLLVLAVVLLRREGRPGPLPAGPAG